MFIFYVAAPLVWLFVLFLFVATDVRLILRTTRWAATIYLLVFGLSIIEVLQQGLASLGADSDRLLYVRWGWFGWYIFVILGALRWEYLVIPAVMSFYLLNNPDIRMILNYGLIRMGMLDLVYSPVWYVVKRLVLSHVL
ncbi:hypothetical protein F4804DRAFT_68279 [Jackrogersella minutella]|nr:hypothetical protein F4804DRAFT_68279 [Jackrogersella minutella]